MKLVRGNGTNSLLTESLREYTMRQAKFCTAWSLSRLAWVVLLQTEEQWYNLLNTRAFIIIIKARLSKICLTRLIWPNRDMQEDTVETVCSLYVKLESSVTPRSLAALTGSSSFPNRNSLKSLTLAVICRLPNITSFVLSGLSKSWLSKHQFRIFNKSLFIFAIASCWSWSWNDRRSLVSSTEHCDEQFSVTEGRSLT